MNTLAHIATNFVDHETIATVHVADDRCAQWLLSHATGATPGVEKKRF